MENYLIQRLESAVTRLESISVGFTPGDLPASGGDAAVDPSVKVFEELIEQYVVRVSTASSKIRGQVNDVTKLLEQAKELLIETNQSPIAKVEGYTLMENNLIQQLESVVAGLESLSVGFAPGGLQGSSGKTVVDPPVKSFKELIEQFVERVLTAASKIEGQVEDVTKVFEQAFTVHEELLIKTKQTQYVKPVKEETVSTLKNSVPAKGASSAPADSGSALAGQPVTEDEIRAFLMRKTPVTPLDLVTKFKSRLNSKEDKHAFAAILRRISQIQKTTDGRKFIVLRK